jgi:hypothetical protein
MQKGTTWPRRRQHTERKEQDGKQQQAWALGSRGQARKGGMWPWACAARGLAGWSSQQRTQEGASLHGHARARFFKRHMHPELHPELATHAPMRCPAKRTNAGLPDCSCTSLLFFLGVTRAGSVCSDALNQALPLIKGFVLSTYAIATCFFKQY